MNQNGEVYSKPLNLVEKKTFKENIHQLEANIKKSQAIVAVFFIHPILYPISLLIKLIVNKVLINPAFGGWTKNYQCQTPYGNETPPIDNLHFDHFWHDNLTQSSDHNSLNSLSLFSFGITARLNVKWMICLVVKIDRL